MKNKVLFFWVIVLLFSFYSKALASELCSPDGYTVLTINGIFTDENGAILNKNILARKFLPTYNNQPLKFDYVYNPSHFAGASDLVDVVAQGAFNEKEDFDLTNMLNDASQKVTTQKLFLVAHSQGNFYANNFYDKVASQEGGVPSQSIGVYGVATPASYIAGGGKYLTSDTDKVINSYVGSILKILPPNIHIPLQKDDDKNGHSFSDVYLKYQGDRIISDIKSSLGELKNNDEQNSQESCISAPKLTLIHKIKGVAFAVADPTANVIKSGLVGVYDTGVYLASGIHNVTLALGNMFSNLSASVIDTLPDASSMTTILPSLSEPIKNEFAKTAPSSDSNLVALNDTEPIDVDPIIENPTLIQQETATDNISIDPVIVESAEQTSEVTIPETIPNTETTPVYLASSGGGGSPPVDTTPPIVPEVNPIVLDTTPPVITLNGNDTEVVIKNSVYTDAGATAFDNVDGVIGVVTTGTADTATVGTYTITYSATDTAGNPATKTRIIVVDDGAKLHHPSSVFVSGKYAYVVSSDSNSLEIIDISNPALLVHKGSVVHRVNGIEMFAPRSVAVSGNYAYVVSYSNALEVIDISNPSLPVHKSTLLNNDGGAAIFRPNDIVVSGDYAYIVDYGGNSLEIVDISNPLAPVHKGKIYGEGMSSLYGPISLFVSGNYVYTTSGLSNSFEIFDVSNPELPVRKSITYDDYNGVSMNNPQSIAISGNYAYVVSRGDNALEVLDISNPEAPTHVGFIKDGDGGASLYAPIFVAVSGNYAYVVSFVGSTLEVIDISNPSAPVHKATLPNNIGGASLSYPSRIFISGNYAYISSTMSDALEIIDISNPLAPVHAGKILNGEYTHTTTPTVFSSEKKINSFDFTDLKVIGNIDETNHAISLSVPNGTNITALAPNFTISTGAITIPTLGEGKDFTNPVNYLVYAEDGSTQNYVVTVTVLPPLPPVPDTTPPAVTNYTLNDNSSDITINPTLLKPLSLVVNASENVDWTSIKIEKEDNSKLYKYFYPGVDCDGKNTCTQDWDGILKGGLIENGVYKIKVKMKDLAGNLYDSYLSPYVINVDTSL